MILFENETYVIEANDTIRFAFEKRKFDKSFKNFLKQYPDYITNAIKVGSDAISNYRTVKNQTARFFARTPLEKKLYGDITKTLKASGKFKLLTPKVKDGGIFYELVRL